MNYLLLTEKLTNREILITTYQVSSISFNDLMKSILVVTTHDKFQCSKVEFIDLATAQNILNNFTYLINE